MDVVLKLRTHGRHSVFLKLYFETLLVACFWFDIMCWDNKDYVKQAAVTRIHTRIVCIYF